MTIKTKGLLTVLLAYVFAIIFGFISLAYTSSLSQMLQILIADVVATIIIYAFSYGFKNSSFYDPYWSVIPPIITFYWIAELVICHLDFSRLICRIVSKGFSMHD